MAKFHSILESLRAHILSGKYTASRRLPSENELAQRFGVSRPTAARAIRELVALGLLERRVGSGTYLRNPKPQRAAQQRLFGLLVPGLGNTEILDPICNEITRFAQGAGAAVLWGDPSAGASAGSADEARRLCRFYIEQSVNGVFFAPIEAEPDRQRINVEIADKLAQANIAVTLLDRDILDFPGRCRLDLIGIDNFHAGMILTRHLLALGHRRLCFVARPGHPSTTDMRIAGCREAMVRHGLVPADDWRQFGDPADADFVRKVLDSHKPDAFVCANDLTAALLIQTLTGNLGLVLPRDIAVVGFDDVKYSTLLGVPLTTMRQPCRAIAQAAVGAMVARLGEPELPPRQILLTAELVIRRSCGSGSSHAV